MDQWIAALAGLLGSSVSSLARETAQRLMSIWKTVTGFFGRVKAGWDRLYGRARRWATAQARHAVATLNALRWIVVTVIPYKISTLADSIAAWARERIADAVAFVSAGLAQLRDWTTRAVALALAELRNLRDWALREVARIASLLASTAQRVADLLTSPDRLVAWILEPLARALWDLAERNLERIGELAWRARHRIIARGLEALEHVLARVI